VREALGALMEIDGAISGGWPAGQRGDLKLLRYWECGCLCSWRLFVQLAREWQLAAVVDAALPCCAWRPCKSQAHALHLSHAFD